MRNAIRLVIDGLRNPNFIDNYFYLKSKKILVKGSDSLNFKLKVVIRKGKAVFTIIGSEITIEIGHEGFGSFEIYFLDFYDAVNSKSFSLFEDINFIVEPKMIQIGPRKLSFTNSNFSAKTQKKL